MKNFLVLIFLVLFSITVRSQEITSILSASDEDEGSNPDQMAMISSDAKTNINLQDFSLPSVEDEKKLISLSKFSGKPLFMTFFSVGCGHCQTMMEDLKCVTEQLPAKVNAIAVGVDSASKTMVKYIKKQKLTFPAVVGIKELEKRVGGVDATPYTFLLDPSGNIIGKTYGTMDCTHIIEYLKKLGFDK